MESFRLTFDNDCAPGLEIQWLTVLDLLAQLGQPLDELPDFLIG